MTAAEVSAAHLRLCATLHPDRAHNALERDELMRRAAAAGQAKQQLMSDVGRAEAVLGLAGVPAADVPLPPQFLAQTMELRERIEDAMNDSDARNQVGAEVGEARAACVAALASACDELSAAEAHGDQGARAPRDALGASARSALARLRYLDRMITRLAEAPS